VRLGPYDIHPGIRAVVGLAIVVAGLAVAIRARSHKVRDDLQTVARDQSWTWMGAAPAELQECLDRLQSGDSWNASHVMSAGRWDGNAYLFSFVSRKQFVSSGSRYLGIACLLPGRTAPNAPTYSIGQWPPGIGRSIAALKPNRLDDVGGPEFRERYYVESSSAVHDSEETRVKPEPVTVPPALEAELLRWHGATERGLPDGWSRIVIRDELAMILWNSTDDLSANAWRSLLSKGEAVRRALTED
jgi:hypothetical protein